MPKESGIGATLSWDDSGGTPRTIGSDVGDASFDISRADLQVPGLADTAMSRVSGLTDFQITANGFFNDATNQWFDVVKTIGSSTASRTIAFALSGQTLTNECQMLSVNFTRARDGGMAVNATAALSDGATITWA
jgi:hypothetical protein